MKIDIKDCKNTTAIRDKIRKDMTALLIEFLKEKFEDEPEDVVQVGTNEIAVCVAIAEDADGFPHDVCVVVKPEVKPHLDSIGEKREVFAYDRFAAAEEYEMELKAKAAKRKGKK
jgi:hypothetical protein